MSYPNIPFPTMGGKYLWTILKRRKGWKLQRNGITGHYRILNPDNIRQAWGQVYDDMCQELDIFTNSDDESKEN